MFNARGRWIAGGLTLVLLAIGLAIGLYVHRYMPVAILAAALVFGVPRTVLTKR